MQRNNVRQQIETLKDEQAVVLNEKIREVTNSNPNITGEAIESIKNNPFLKTMIQEKEELYKRPLELEDYRQDGVLREVVKGKIVELSPESFKNILQPFEEKLTLLEQSLEELKV